MPLQLFNAHLFLDFKILQGYIVRIDFGLMQPQVVLPSLQAMYRNK